MRSDQTTEVTVENRRLPGALTVRSVGPAGEALTGACFSVWSVKPDGSRDRRLVRSCDGDDGVGDGVTTFASLAPGNVILHEDRAPDEYRSAADQSVTVISGEATNVSVSHQSQRSSGPSNQTGQNARTEPTPIPVPTLTPTPIPTEPVPTPTPELAPVEIPDPTATPEPTATATATATPDAAVETDNQASPEADGEEP